MLNLSIINYKLKICVNFMTFIVNDFFLYLFIIMAIFLIFNTKTQNNHFLPINEKHIELFTKNYIIINYKKINQNQKNNMINVLKKDYIDPSFILNWGYYYDLYIMAYDDIFYGMIGVKHMNNTYIIYNLYVNKKYRNQGYAIILLNFICKILKQKYNQSTAYLYCKNELLSFYYKLNWSHIKYDYCKQGHLMSKHIN